VEEAMAEARIDREKLRQIKKVILEEAEKLGVGVEKIILFGSRARGEAGEESDYDILIVVKDRPSWKPLFKLQSRIRIRLFKLLGSELDLIIIEKKRFDERKESWGSIEYTATREGVVV